MAQVKIHLEEEEYDYSKLVGKNGTANYPACFLYLYTLLFTYLDKGTNIYVGQIIHCFLYSFYAYFTHRIYKLIFKKNELPFLSAALIF
jgi:hypothetical protein